MGDAERDADMVRELELHSCDSRSETERFLVKTSSRECPWQWGGEGSQSKGEDQKRQLGKAGGSQPNQNSSKSKVGVLSERKKASQGSSYICIKSLAKW